MSRIQENVKGLHREELQAYIRTHYTAPRMVVAGAGAVEHERLVELSQKYFGQLPLQALPGVDTGMDPAVFVGSDKRVKVRAWLAVSLNWGFTRQSINRATHQPITQRIRARRRRRRTWRWPFGARPGPRSSPSRSWCCRPSWVAGTARPRRGATSPRGWARTWPRGSSVTRTSPSTPATRYVRALNDAGRHEGMAKV